MDVWKRNRLRMPDYPVIHQIIVQSCDLLDVVEVTERTDETSWCFVVSDEMIVEAIFDEESDRLVLSTNLGAVALENKDRLLPLLLAYNAMWRETGGGKMAMTPGSFEVEFLFDLVASTLDASTFCTVFDHFVAVAADWKDVVGSPMASSEIEDSLGDLSGALRV